MLAREKARYHIIKMLRYYNTFWQIIKKEIFKWPVKGGNSKDGPKKIREETSSIEYFIEMLDDICAESLKSPSCVEILFNCLRNLKQQMNEIFVLAKPTQESRLKEKGSRMTKWLSRITQKASWPAWAVFKKEMYTKSSKGQSNGWYNYRNNKPKFEYGYCT